MDDGKLLWSIWQRLLSAFSGVFTRPGWVRLVQWVSGTVLCNEEHTITQLLTSLGQTDEWRNCEHFAEYGAFNTKEVESTLMRLLEQEHPSRFGPYHPVAVDDTKELRSSGEVWGVCTYKHRSSRNPNHPKLAMGHNWVVMGDLSPGAGKEPWTYLPTTSRLYFRKGQMPADEVFATKNELAVEMLKQADAASGAPILGILDGGYARRSVIRPCLQGATDTGRRIEILTRPRCDARLYEPLEQPAKPNRGRRRIWGKPLPAPEKYEEWNVPWMHGQAWAYGRMRTFKYKMVECRWSVSGPGNPMHMFVFEVEGYNKPWFIVTSALDLSAAQVLEAYTARFRQEDCIRDHKQRMGMEEARAWTKAPVLRTFTVQQLSITLLRLVQWEWEKHHGEGWCPAPAWNKHKTRVSILDMRRLLWEHRGEFSQFIREMIELRKIPRPAA